MTPDALIVGGGLSGSAAALLLARAGLGVHLLERSDGPGPRICGEFLSIEAQRDLAGLGIDCNALGAVPVDRLRLIWGGRMAETRLPFVARGLSRTVLDEAMLASAARAGATVERGVRATRLVDGAAQTSRGERGGKAVLLATGKHALRLDDGAAATPAPKDPHVGFKMQWRMPPALAARIAGTIELTLFPGGYAGLQPVGPAQANLCLALRRSRFRQWGGTWEGLLRHLSPLSPALGMLADAEPLFARPVTIAGLPYGHVHRPVAGERLWRLGDQAAMTASLTGDGMAIALRSALLAARALREGRGADFYHRALRHMAGAQVRRGMMLQRLAALPGARVPAMALLSLSPALLRPLAAMTRLPEEAML